MKQVDGSAQGSAEAAMAAKYFMADVFGVEGDKWLGEANGLVYVAQGRGANHAVCIASTGALKMFRKATKLVTHAKREGRQLSAGECMSNCRQLAAVAADMKLESLVEAGNQKVWKEVADNEAVVFKYGCGEHAKSDVGYKAADGKGRKVMYPHSKAHRTLATTQEDASRTWWFKGSTPAGMVVMTMEAAAAWERAVEQCVVESGLTEREYQYSVGAINAEVLRVAAVIGKRAVASPFDVAKGCATVKVGNKSIVIEQNAADMMDVRVVSGDRTLSSREDAVSVRMEIEGTAGILSGNMTYTELGVAAYEAWRDAGAGSKNSARADGKA